MVKRWVNPFTEGFDKVAKQQQTDRDGCQPIAPQGIFPLDEKIIELEARIFRLELALVHVNDGLDVTDATKAALMKLREYVKRKLSTIDCLNIESDKD